MNLSTICFTIITCGVDDDKVDENDDNKNKLSLLKCNAQDDVTEAVTGALQSSCSEKSHKIHSNTSAMVGFLI